MKNLKMRLKKGAAIEMAIMVMVVTVSMSIVILTTALLQHSKQVRANEEMSRRVVLEQIGQDFCDAANTSDHTWVAKYPDYDITIDGLNLSVTKKDNESALLRVTLENIGGTYRILVWDAR